MAKFGIEEAIDRDVCQHEGCSQLGCVMWDWYNKAWVSYCVYHMAEHGFCPICQSNTFQLNDSVCSRCTLTREVNDV